MKRRSFIKHAGHCLAIPGILGSFGFGSAPFSVSKLMQAAQEMDRVLVLIFLSGGNDGLNTVVPLSQYGKYHTLRPEVVLPENSLHKLKGTNLALHPSLGYLKDLFDEKRLSLVQSVGYPEQNFSHFRSTDIWLSGSRADEYLSSGWTGRYLNHLFPSYPDGYPNEEFTDPLAIEIGRGGSLLFQGPSSSMGMTISNPEDFYRLLAEETGVVPNTLAGNKLEHIQLIAQQSQAYGKVVRDASAKVSTQKNYPNTQLANQLKIVARLIAGGLKTPVYMVKIGGFDTHASQVDSLDHTKGKHATLLSSLNGAIKAFMADLAYLNVDDKVVGMTFSEFGRRIVSNSSYGTDHGAAAPMFVFGNRVNGGVFGTDPVLPTQRSVNSNIEQQFDFRQIYSSILEQWFAVNQMDENSIMLEELETIPIIEDLAFKDISIERDTLSVFPSPIQDDTRIAFTADGNPVRVDLYDYMGRHVKLLYKGAPVFGKKMFNWNTRDLQNGVYVVRVTGSTFSHSRKVVKR